MLARGDLGTTVALSVWQVKGYGRETGHEILGKEQRLTSEKCMHHPKACALHCKGSKRWWVISLVWALEAHSATVRWLEGSYSPFPPCSSGFCLTPVLVSHELAPPTFFNPGTQTQSMQALYLWISPPTQFISPHIYSVCVVACVSPSRIHAWSEQIQLIY